MVKREQEERKRGWWWFSAILILFVMMSQFVIFGINREPWFDTAFSLQTAHTIDVEGVGAIDFSQYDVHPMIFYNVLARWQQIPHGGISEYHWAQELEVVMGVIFFLFAGAALYALFGTVGLWVTFLLTMCTTYLHYFTEIRMYAFVLAYSAMLFYAIAVERAKRGWWWLVAIVFILLPFTHYLAAMAIPFFVMLLWLLRDKEEKKSKQRVIWLLVIGIIATAAAFFLLALPQVHRVQGNWFQPPAVTEWPSAVMYAFFMTDLFTPTGWMAVAFLAMYVGFALFLIWCAWRAWKLMNKGRLEREEVLLFMMGMTALFPLVGLVAGSGVGGLIGQGFAHLYHHRFFLVVDWLFAAMAFVVLVKWMKKSSVRLFTGTVLLVVVIGGMQVAYATMITHHELQHLMQQTPCPTGDEQGIQIAHESPFSALPYIVYAREHGCKWWNFVSTNQTPKMLNGGGGDAMPVGTLFFNQTLPAGDYYYIYAAGTVPVDGTPVKVALEDGVELWYVERQEHNGTDRYVWYDNSTEYQYTRVRWS